MTTPIVAPTLLAQADAIPVGLKTPARRDQPTPGPIATTGGPVKPPTREVGEGRSPGLVPTQDGSVGSPPAPGAGADFRLPRDIRGPQNT